MELLQSSGQPGVRNDGTGEIRKLISARDVQGQLPERFGIEA